MNGKVRNILESKGFGFIIGDDLKIYFFHRDDCINGDFDLIQPRMQVTFQDDKTDKGLRARNVVVL